MVWLLILTGSHLAGAGARLRLRKGFMQMMTEQSVLDPTAAADNPPRDLIAKLYREIGISAVAAALAASARKPQKPNQSQQEIPAILRGEEAA